MNDKCWFEEVYYFSILCHAEAMTVNTTVLLGVSKANSSSLTTGFEPSRFQLELFDFHEAHSEPN